MSFVFEERFMSEEQKADAVEAAKQELDVIAPASQEEAIPKSLEEIIFNLKGWGIEDFEDVLTLRCKGKDLRIKIANIPTSDEMFAVQAADDFKGYLWIKRVKVELISRAISWIDGIDIRNLPNEERFVPDPTDSNKTVRDIQVVLRNTIMTWGQELVESLWKVLMNHSQNIEDRLKSEFPQNALMTEVEARLIERARKQMDESFQVIRDEQVAALYDTTPEKLPEEEEAK
jgi:hypothetical protein